MLRVSRVLRQCLRMSVCLGLAACGGGGSGGGSAGMGGSGGNSAPVITSAAAASIPENSSGAVYTASASDADGNSLTYSLSGSDAARFSINAATGAVSFVSSPNFEWPLDANHDNIYDVMVNVSDGTNSVSKAVSLTVTDRVGRVSTRRVAQGFTQPLYVLGRGDGSGRLLVVEKTGKVKVLDPLTGAVDPQPFLDVSSYITTDSERGLLGLALAPDFATSGIFYAYLTVANGEIQVRKFTATAAGATNNTGDVILTISHSVNSNHNGGWIGFDKDGLLVIAVGDGGGAGDTPGNAQNKNVLLGKILRIDPRTDAFPTDPNRDYSIPAGNPFASGGGAPEIWHWGLRNPFRNSFDPVTNNFYIGDVGQDAWEEVDLVRPTDPGFNFGWNTLEATHTFNAGSTAGMTAPVLEYPHGAGALQGSSLIGGYVYRGPVIALRGQYVFGDYVNKRIWSVTATSLVPGTTLANTSFTDRTAAFAPAAGVIGNLTSFGIDDMGNLYVVDIDGEIFLVDEVDEV